MISFAVRNLGKLAVVYPVVEQNGSSRRLAESLGGSIVGTRLLRKAGGVEYIPKSFIEFQRPRMAERTQPSTWSRGLTEPAAHWLDRSSNPNRY